MPERAQHFDSMRLCLMSYVGGCLPSAKELRKIARVCEISLIMLASTRICAFYTPTCHEDMCVLSY